MRSFKRILIYLLIFSTIISLLAVSYFYAYRRTKKELVGFLYKKWGDRVKIESYRFNPLSGLLFEKIEVKNLFVIKKIRISYNILSLIKRKSIGAVHVDTLILNTTVFKAEKNKTGQDNRLSIPFSFAISDFNINFLKLLHNEKIYEARDISGFLRVEKNGEFLSLLALNFLKPYPFYIKTLATGDIKEQNFKILDFRNKVFDTRGEISLDFPFLRFKLRNSKFDKFYFDYIEGKVKIKDNDIDIIFIDAKEKRGEFTLSGELKNYRDLNKMSFEAVSYIKGEYFFKEHRFNFELISETNFTRKKSQVNLYIEDLKIDELYEFAGFSMFTFFPKKDSFSIDTFKINYKGISLHAKGGYPGEIKIGINVSENNEINYLQGSKGEILGIYRGDIKSYTFVMYGSIKDFTYNDLRIPEFNFSVGRDTTGENFLTFNFDSLFYKQILLGNLNLNFKGKDSLFFFNLDANTPFAGAFENRGIMVMGKNYYMVVDSLNRLKMKFSEGVFEASLKGIEIWGGKVFLNAYFDAKNKGVIALLNARNLRVEEIQLRNVLIDGIFDIDMDLRGKKDTFNITTSFRADTFFLNDVPLTGFWIDGYGDQNKITLDIKAKVMDEGLLRLYGIINLNEGLSLNKGYEFEIAAEKLPLKEFQKFLRLNFINFDKGRIFANCKIKKSELQGDILIERGEGEILYTLSPFYNMFLFLKIDKNKFNGRFNGYSGEGDFRGNIKGKMERGRLENFELSTEFKKIPVFYNFIDSKASGKFNISIDRENKNMILDSKIEEAYIVPAFKGGEQKGRSPSDFFFDFLFKSDGKIFLFNEWIDAELKGEMRVKKQDPVNYYLSGELEVIQGKIFYLGNVFEIKEGKIFFLAQKDIIPEISLRAELPYNIKDENIRIILEISGKLSEPQFKIYSEPLALDESTLIKYITFGQAGAKPFSEIGTKGMYIGEKLLSAQVKKQVRISEFSLIGGGNPSILFGTYISPELYVKYQHDFLSYYKDSFLVKYFLNPRFSIYSKRERTGEMVTGLELEFRF